MNSRAIALGASVIALTVGGAGQAEAGVLGDAGLQLPDAGVGAKVEANAEVPVVGRSKASLDAALEADIRRSGHPRTTVDTKRRNGDDQSYVVVKSDSRRGVSAHADQHRKGRFELEAEGQVGPNHAESKVTGFSRRADKAGFRGRVHTPKAKHARAERSIRDHSRKVAGTDALGSLGRPGKKLTLQGIGRQVANPTRLILAGWLITLTGAGCLGIARLVRRLQHTG